MADSAISELIKQLKEEAVTERQKTLELLAKQAENGGRIGIANLDENLIRLIMTATTKTKSSSSKTEKGTPPEKEKQDSDNLELNEIEIKAIDDLLNKNNVYLYGKAGTGKTVSAKKIAKRLYKDGFIKNPQMFYVLNCSQWTSPIQILGGWSIGGYKQGLATMAWMNGGVLILDELPKLDANTAGLLNEILSSTTESDATIVNGETDGKIPKHPDFYVIGTGNTDLKTTSMNFGGNNQQDYSLVDRFAGSMYYVDFDFVKELSLTTYPVFAIALGIRNFLLKDVNSVESVSLRTMLNFNRIYELEMLREYFPSSPLLVNKNNYDTVTIDDFDEDGNPIKREVNQGKTLKDSVYSFVNTLPVTKKNNILAEKLDTVAGYSGLTIDEALSLAKDNVEVFESEYIRLHGVSPVNEEPTHLSENQKRDFERIKESLPQKP